MTLARPLHKDSGLRPQVERSNGSGPGEWLAIALVAAVTLCAMRVLGL